jgi:transcriptional regulator with XRE-family HTH domain
LELCEKIKEKRNSLGLSQKKLADMVEVSMSTLRRWESGAREPVASDLCKLATALNTSVADMTGDTSDREQKEFKVNLVIQADEASLSEEQKQYAKEHNIQYVERIPCNSFWPFMGTEEEVGKEATILTKITTNPRKYAIAGLLADMNDDQLRKAYEYLYDQKQLGEYLKEKGA